MNIGTFYFSGAAEPWDWTAPHNDNLWQDGSKTLFDPCPAGWRVPKGGAGTLSPWSAFTLENGVWHGLTDLTDSTAGRYFMSGTVWYGVTGGRSQISANLAWGCQWCHVWSSHLTPEQYWILRFNGVKIDNGGQTHAPAIGLSVRCLRE